MGPKASEIHRVRYGRTYHRAGPSCTLYEHRDLEEASLAPCRGSVVAGGGRLRGQVDGDLTHSPWYTHVHVTYRVGGGNTSPSSPLTTCRCHRLVFRFCDGIPIFAHVRQTQAYRILERIEPCGLPASPAGRALRSFLPAEPSQDPCSETPESNSIPLRNCYAYSKGRFLNCSICKVWNKGSIVEG